MKRKVSPMRAQRTRRLFAASAASVLLAGGAALGAAGTASAGTFDHHEGRGSYSSGCDDDNWSNNCGGYGGDHGGYGGDHGSYGGDHGGHGGGGGGHGGR